MLGSGVPFPTGEIPVPTQIAILDDDHVIRLTRYAISGPGEITSAWAREFFMPEDVDPARVYALGDGLHESDGVSLIPMAAKADLRKCSDAAILIFRRGTIDAALMDANPNLKLIQRIGARADAIDLAAAAERGIPVSCVPRRVLQYTAEHAILMMLALSKKLLEADDAVRKDRWDRDRVRPDHGVAYNWVGIGGIGGLFGKTLGIVGLGEVGSLAAGMARGFGMRVLYCNRNRLPAAQEAKLGVEYAAIGTLLAESDFVSLHATNIPENRGLIGAETFAAMKPTAFFINTARGPIVDEDALYDALAIGTIGGAGLDVHTVEPRPMPDRLATLRNVILTPHIAGGSRQGIMLEIEAILDNCRAVLTGDPIQYQVTG
ncbi:MAG: glyoxylate reductase [Hyphomicrobiales bacterium]|nr:glyoxylate reductase [Hyphomicrobiales bacterium]